jgi:transcriptional regulator with XRE-family HTH domain
MDWEAIFMSVSEKVTTVIIGCDADFRRRDRISREEVAKIIQSLKDYVNLSFDSEATIAAKIGVSPDTLNGSLRGKIKPRVESLLRVQAFLNRQPKTRGGITRVGYVPLC